jgi:nitrous oxidase accessory protein
MFSHEDDYVNNVFQNNGSGVAIMYTKGVTMKGNLFGDNHGAASYALLLKDIGDSKVLNCRFMNNTVGVYMEGSSRCLFSDNEFRNNGWALKLQASCDNNTLTRNNFVGNTFDVATNGSISLNELSANYWDKYDGYDMNRDGTGDIPFHPVSLYGMIVERMPTAVLFWRSFLVYLLDRAEKVVPAVTPENLRDEKPAMKVYDRG